MSATPTKTGRKRWLRQHLREALSKYPHSFTAYQISQWKLPHPATREQIVFALAGLANDGSIRLVRRGKPGRWSHQAAVYERRSAGVMKGVA